MSYDLELATGQTERRFKIGEREFIGKEFTMGELRKLRANDNGLEGEQKVLAELLKSRAVDKRPVKPELFDELTEAEYLALFKYLSGGEADPKAKTG